MTLTDVETLIFLKLLHPKNTFEKGRRRESPRDPLLSVFPGIFGIAFFTNCSFFERGRYILKMGIVMTHDSSTELETSAI